MHGCEGVGRDIDHAAMPLGLNPAIGRVIVTHRFSLEAAAGDRKARAIKVRLEPWSRP